MAQLRQATAAMNGFEFQKYAGIFLMLKNFDSFKALKIEGESQDVEIEKDNGAFLFIQAKAAEKPYEIKDSEARQRFKKALESFVDTKTSNEHDSLVYINNFEQRSPFGIKWPSFNNPYYFTYGELPNYLREEIDSFPDIAKIEKEKLVFAGLSFYGNDSDTRVKQIHDKLKEILADINPILVPQSMLILGGWSSQFGLNGTNKVGKITKASIASDLTFYTLRGTDIPVDYKEKLGISEEDYLEATSSFGEMIEKKGLGFKEYNMINKGYNDARVLRGRVSIADYINENLESIIYALALDENSAPDNIRKTVAKIIAFRLITRSSQLDEIYNKLRSF